MSQLFDSERLKKNIKRTKYKQTHAPPYDRHGFRPRCNCLVTLSQSTNHYAYIMYPVGSVTCSSQSHLLWSFTPVISFFIILFFGKRFYDQDASGFRIPNFSGFRRFWIPIHWIPDSKIQNSKFRRFRIPDSGFCYIGRYNIHVNLRNCSPLYEWKYIKTNVLSLNVLITLMCYQF